MLKRKCKCWLEVGECMCDMENTKIDWTPVKSSQIRNLAFDGETQTLFVQFKNKKTYTYAPVSQEQYDDFKESKSIGAYFHKNFKMNPVLKIKQI